MNSYIARQPIFKKNLSIFGYELLFRGNASEKSYSGTDADQASSRVAMESFHSRGVDTITGGKPAFINFTANLLMENIATLFPRDRLVIELLEDIEPTPELVKACRDLHKQGYVLALDDFVYRPELEPLIEICRIIKFDFLLSTPQEIQTMLGRINLTDKLLLAEKIETREMFELASSMGFSLFQGYFFSKPVTLAAKEIAPLKISYASMLQEINSEDDMDFVSLASVIRNDLALSYKLLKLVNSTYFGLRSEVVDINRALTVLGTKEIRKWVFMLAVMGLSSDKPDEIVKMSMIRGRFIEELNKKFGLCRSSENAFMTGLFSMINVLMEQPMEKALDGMFLAEEIRAALVDNAWPLHGLLELAISLERSEWDEADRLAAELGIDASCVPVVYLDAVKWCNELPL